MADADNEAEGVSESTRSAEATEGSAAHAADRPPTEGEEVLADESTGEIERTGRAGSVAEHHAEMDRRGTEARGEGRID